METYAEELAAYHGSWIKVTSDGRELCLSCADSLEVDGVIVERAGFCENCEDII